MDRPRKGPGRISPTAHYTGYVWARHGLGVGSLSTTQGRVLHTLTRTFGAPLEAVGGPTLESFLLARHRLIDHLLAAELAGDRVTQVVELGAGLSPRGLRVTRQHPTATYVEVDLPGMVERKRELLAREGTDARRHRVVPGDVFAHELTGVFHGLDPGHGVAVVTEGLLNYFPTDRVVGLWARVADQLGRFPSGVYLGDLHLGSSAGVLDRVVATGLGLFVRGAVHFHFEDETEAEARLRETGFRNARLRAPREYADLLPGMTARGADRVRVLEARV